MKSVARPRTFLDLPLVVLVSFGAASVVSAQWSDDPAVNLLVADRSGTQTIPLVGSTSDGGTWIAWFDDAAGSFDVYVQRLDAAGVEQFAHNGLLVSDHAQDTALFGWDMVVDADDHAVIVFSDIRDGGDLDIFAYRIGPQGDPVWGADGIQLSFTADFEPAPRVTQASDGDLVFVWLRDPATGDGDLRMQRIAPDGTVRLVAGGLPVIAAAGDSPGFVNIAPAENGNVVISYLRSIASFISPRHVRAAKFSPTGAALWPGPVSVYDAFSLPIGYFPQILSDGAGGAVILWHRSDGTWFNSFIQHVDAAGVEQFPHNGVAVSNNATMHHIDPTFSRNAATGEVFVFWNERNSTQSQWGLFGQKFSAAGAPQWSASGIAFLPVSPVYRGPARSVQVGDGAVAVWVDQPLGTDRLAALRVDGAGATVWPTPIVALSTAAGGKSRYPLTIDSGGVTTTVWEDTRSGATDLYAQNIDAAGALGAVPAPGDVAQSLRLVRSTLTPGDLTLSWAASCSGGATDYAIYEGVMGDFTSHTLKDCTDDGGDLTEDIFPAASSSYYLLVALGAGDEGSYGTDSEGAERPPPAAPADRCRTTQEFGGCGP